MESDRYGPSPRTGHVAVCVDENLLVFGGYKNSNGYSVGDQYVFANEIWAYNLEFEDWIQVQTHGLSVPGFSGSAVYLVEGCVYIFAGHTDEGNVNDLYRLNLTTLEWTVVLPKSGCDMPSPRDKFASWTHSGKLYCFGGFGVPIHMFLKQHGSYVEDESIRYASRGWNNQVLEYDIQANKWSALKTKGNTPSPRAAHTAACIGNCVYVFGGRHCETRLNELHCLNMDTLTWSGQLHTTGEEPCARSWHTFTALPGGFVFLYGGYSQDGHPLSDAWLLNTNNLSWTQINLPWNKPRLWHTSCYCHPVGEVLVYGGCCNNILSFEERTIHSNELLVFHFQPKSLVRSCLGVVYENKLRIEDRWKELPESLQQWLKTKLNRDKMRECNNSNNAIGDRNHNTCRAHATCALS